MSTNHFNITLIWKILCENNFFLVNIKVIEKLFLFVPKMLHIDIEMGTAMLLTEGRNKF